MKLTWYKQKNGLKQKIPQKLFACEKALMTRKK